MTNAALFWTLLVLTSVPIASAISYSETVQQWRQTREAKLKADDGWLTVAGLFWLEPGSNKTGSEDENPVRLPDGYPKVFGSFDRKGEEVVFKSASGIFTTPGGPEIAMKSDGGGETPDLLRFRDLTLFVIKRGDRLGIRLRDTKSKMRREFKGLHWFPVKESYRIEAKWVAYAQPKAIAIPNVLNQIEEQKSLGYAIFQLNGKEHTLEPVVEGQELFYIFKDMTAGKQTYPAGRFLYSEMPVNGKVILDFNKAHNPPCAFTPYATCPLPPKQNRLQTRIEAGELTYGHY